MDNTHNGAGMETRYRGCTITQIRDHGESMFYVHHHSEAQDFGARSTLASAKTLVDKLITTGQLPKEGDNA